MIHRYGDEDVASWSAAKINRMLDALDKRSSRLTDAFIKAGRGHERPSEYLEKDDLLSREAREVFDVKSRIRREVERRYGPGAPQRLPRGFGPIRSGR